MALCKISQAAAICQLGILPTTGAEPLPLRPKEDEQQVGVWQRSSSFPVASSGQWTQLGRTLCPGPSHEPPVPASVAGGGAAERLLGHPPGVVCEGSCWSTPPRKRQLRGGPARPRPLLLPPIRYSRRRSAPPRRAQAVTQLPQALFPVERASWTLLRPR